MKAKADPEFWRRYNELPARVQELAQKNYALWLANPFHPSLQFKEINKGQWSARVGLNYRAAGYFLSPTFLSGIGLARTRNTINSDACRQTKNQHAVLCRVPVG